MRKAARWPTAAQGSDRPSALSAADGRASPKLTPYSFALYPLVMSAQQLFSLRKLAALCLFTAALLVGVKAHAQVYKSDGSPVLAGAKSVPRGINLCNDYASKRDYSGAPYRVVEPDRIVTRHEGIDFCARAGTPVIAPVGGRIRSAIKDHPLRGGADFNQDRFPDQYRARREQARLHRVGPYHTARQSALGQSGETGSSDRTCAQGGAGRDRFAPACAFHGANLRHNS